MATDLLTQGGVSYRPLTKDDVDALYALEVAAQPLPWTRDQVLLELMHDDAHVIGAFPEGPPGGQRTHHNSLIGYVAFRVMVDELWVLNVAVLPAHQRRGLGRALMSHGASVAAQRACTSLWLEVRESNATAQRLYQRLGFSTRGRRVGYYRPVAPSTTPETAVVMSRLLGDG